LNPEELGRKIYDILGIASGDTIVLSRDKLTAGVLVSIEKVEAS
jgi:hypothetical protein